MNIVSVVYISNSLWVIVKVCCYWNSVYIAGSLCSLETESLTAERWFGIYTFGSQYPCGELGVFMYVPVTPVLWDLETEGSLQRAGCQPSSGFRERPCLKGTQKSDGAVHPVSSGFCMHAQFLIVHTYTEKGREKIEKLSKFMETP